MLTKTISLIELAQTLRKLPELFVQHRLDELVVATMIEDLGMTVDEGREFAALALVDDHFRELISCQSPAVDNPFSRFARKNFHQCVNCKAKYVTEAQLTQHDCASNMRKKHVTIQPKLGRDALDFDSLE